jgi:hypothetical protein
VAFRLVGLVQVRVLVPAQAQVLALEQVTVLTLKVKTFAKNIPR